MLRRNVFLLVIALVVVLGLSESCTTHQPKPASQPTPKEVQITEKDGACGSGVGLNPGDTLVLILEGNPSTGYGWEVGFYVPQVITPVGEPEYQAVSNLVGSEGKYTFRFLAVGEGQVALRMIYHRSWEKDVPDLKTCEVNVTVQ